MDSLQDFIDRFKSAFYSDDYTSLTSLMDELEQLQSESEEASSYLSQVPEISIFRKDMQVLSEILNYLYETSDWAPVKIEDGISIFSRSCDDNLYVKCEMTLEAPMFQVLALISEVDLLPTW